MVMYDSESGEIIENGQTCRYGIKINKSDMRRDISSHFFNSSFNTENNCYPLILIDSLSVGNVVMIRQDMNYKKTLYRVEDIYSEDGLRNSKGINPYTHVIVAPFDKTEKIDLIHSSTGSAGKFIQGEKIDSSDIVDIGVVSVVDDMSLAKVYDNIKNEKALIGGIV